MPAAKCQQCEANQITSKVTMQVTSSSSPLHHQHQQQQHYHPCITLTQTRGSKFVKFQDVRLQEVPSQVPVGHVPRMCSARMLGDNTRRCSPGDIVNITGIFLPVPISGFRAMRSGAMGVVSDTCVFPSFSFWFHFNFLLCLVLFRFIFVCFLYCCSTRVFRYIEATHIEQTKKSYDQMEIEGSAALELAKEPDCYTILASSIAPEIYGHLDVKKSLLLQVKARLFF